MMHPTYHWKCEHAVGLCTRWGRLLVRTLFLLTLLSRYEHPHYAYIDDHRAPSALATVLEGIVSTVHQVW
jgi:hypothetical protein